MPTSSHTTFHKPHVLVVEGKDDFWICVKLLEFLSIESVQIVELGGFDNLSAAFNLYKKTPGWTSVERVAVLVDSDGDEAARIQAVKACLKRSGLAEPAECNQFAGQEPAVAFCVIPRGGGCLEDLIREAVEDGSALTQCVNSFIECCGLREQGGSMRAKAWVHAYIAALNPGLKIGEAAKAGILKLESATYDPIRQLLKALRADGQVAAV